MKGLLFIKIVTALVWPSADSRDREPLLNGKDQYNWPPCTNWFRSAACYTKNNSTSQAILLRRTTVLSLSPSIRVPWLSCVTPVSIMRSMCVFKPRLIRFLFLILVSADDICLPYMIKASFTQAMLAAIFAERFSNYYHF